MASHRFDYRPSIDGLRAVAVLLVLAFHVAPDLVPSGFVGVDIFFVISGFLISSILFTDFERPERSGLGVIGRFYQRRVRRIFPSLILVLVACLLAGYVLLMPRAFETEGLHIVASAGFCLNLVLSRATSYFQSDSLTNPLLHIWSLGVEEQFYLVWPLVIWVASRSRLGFVGVGVFIGSCSFFWNSGRPAGIEAQAFYLPQMRLWELSIGAITAAISAKYLSRLRHPSADEAVAGATTSPKPEGDRGHGLANFIGYSGAILIGVGAIALVSRRDVPNSAALLPTLGSAMLILAGESAWINRRVLSQKTLVWIGLISFPLYLWHWPLIVFSQLLFPDTDPVVVRTCAALCAFVLAWLSYRFVEGYCRYGAYGRAKALALTATMCMVACAGYVAYREKGFPGRFPAVIQVLDHYSYDNHSSWREGTCFLDRGQDESSFSRDDSVPSRLKPSLYLWGDSHAAQLYPGYKAAFSGKYNIIERAAASMPPFVGRDIPGLEHGKGINDFIFQAIRRDRPQCVVLAANWCVYDWRLVGETIDKLKAVGIPRIVLVGPVPQWKVGLPQQLFLYSRKHLLAPLPTRMTFGSSDQPPKVDALMRKFAEERGVEYVSPCSILGNKDGFLTRIGDSADSLTAFDYGHLTVVGSEYLVSRFPLEPLTVQKR